MALSLAESAKLSTNQLQAGIIEVIVNEVSVLDRIPMIQITGKGYTYNERATLPGVAWRGITGTYTTTTGTVNQTTEELRILGGVTEVDRYQQNVLGDINDQLAIQMSGQARALAYAWQDCFINGDDSVDANQFDGLKTRLTGAQVITAATNGLAVVGADEAAGLAFFAKLDELIAAVHGKPDALYMNGKVLRMIKQSAMRMKSYETSVDDFGKKIQMYDGIPMYDIGVNASGTDIIPQTETCGSSSITSSIYAVRFSTNESEIGVACVANGGVMVDKLPMIDTKLRGQVELYSGIAVFGGRAAARLKGVLAS